MAEWQDEFGSKALVALNAMGLPAAVIAFIFGQSLFTQNPASTTIGATAGSLVSANAAYFILLLALIVGGFYIYDKISGGEFEVPDGGALLRGLGAGAGVMVGSTLIGSLLRGIPSASIWVPTALVPLSVGGATNQVFLDVFVLFFLVAPGERALVAIGPLMTQLTGIGDDQPLIGQPWAHEFNGLWAALHVAFGQYPWWYFFVTLLSGIGFLWASDVANDYFAASALHGSYDVLARTLKYATTGM